MDDMILDERLNEDTTQFRECTSSTEIPEDAAGQTSDEDSGTDDGIYIVLSTLSAKTLITEDGLARLLGKGCRESIKRAVERNELPRPVRLMGKNTWTVGAIVQHIEARLETEARRFAKART